MPANQISQSCKASSQSLPRHQISVLIASTHGNNPIPLTFQIPSPSAKRFIATYIALAIHSVFFVPSVSYLVNTEFVCKSPWIGFLNSMKTIMMLKIWRELPDMYIMIAFIGNALAGARASSQDFFILSVSVSSGVGAFRSCALDAAERCDGGERLLGRQAGPFFWTQIGTCLAA